MRRRLATITAVVSLVLACACGALWVRSHWVAERVQLVRSAGAPRTMDQLGSARGYLMWGRWTDPKGNVQWQMPPAGWSYGQGPAEYTDPSKNLERPGSHQFLGAGLFYYAFDRPNTPLSGLRETEILLPHWMLTVAFAVLPVTRLLTSGKRKRAARAAAGLCIACGYDLRGHSAGERCPECGAAANAG